VELFLRITLQMNIGLAVCFLPWSGQLFSFLPWAPRFWDQNPLYLYFPALAIYAANGAVRGIVSGLGLLTLWFAVQDAMRGRMRRR
jgi:hypothetical protein